MKNERRGILIILSSPSGAGKSSIARLLMEWDKNIVFSISSTTRDPRPGEKDGRKVRTRVRVKIPYTLQ